jgi:hypothetical protein
VSAAFSLHEQSSNFEFGADPRRKDDATGKGAFVLHHKIKLPTTAAFWRAPNRD